MARDSYELFFKHFKIQFSDVIEFGINEATIYPDDIQVKEKWHELIKSVENNEKVFIRGYGRDAHGTNLYQELYKILLNNHKITKDATNNTKPTQLLQNITNFSKTIKQDNNKKEKITNYQVSHVFGRTKNPFLFTAPWNLVWKPKILDPFTGHESKGTNTQQYKKAFIDQCKELYSEYINEYNELALKYFTDEKIESAFKKMELSFSRDMKYFQKFKIDVKKELSIIE